LDNSITTNMTLSDVSQSPSTASMPLQLTSSIPVTTTTTSGSTKKRFF
jgi:hypothetical protein